MRLSEIQDAVAGRLPMIDCFDGMVVSWSIGTRPNAELANTMRDAAIDKVAASGERPVVHSDRGGHYRWPGWLAGSNRRRQADPFDVTQGMLAGQRSLRGILWSSQDRDVLRPRLALDEHRGVRCGGGCLHPLEQRGSNQKFTWLSQSRRSAPGHRRITSPSFWPHTRGSVFGRRQQSRNQVSVSPADRPSAPPRHPQCAEVSPSLPRTRTQLLSPPSAAAPASRAHAARA